MIELLAITDKRVDTRPPMREVAYHGLAALCVPADSSRHVTREALWRREELIESLMEDSALLPVRFGTVTEDEPAVARTLAERRDEFAAMLDRVRGAVELAVRAQTATPPEHEEHHADNGRSYIRSRVRQAKSVATLHEPLALLARENVTRPGRDLFRAAYLVDRREVDNFVALVRRSQRMHPELHVLCTGPWPPYSFVEPGNQ